MPFVFSCSECGQILYEDASPKNLGRVIEKLGSSCPSCGHKLHLPPVAVTVKIWNGHNGNGKQKK